MNQFDQHNGVYQARPRRDDSLWGGIIKPNIVVYSIIALCIIVFIWAQIDLESLTLMAMWPEWPMPWMFVTSAFMHIDPYHLFFNMFMLFMFGVTLEKMIGSWRFLSLYLIAGVAGNAGYVVFCMATGSDIPAIGASGAIYGVFACLAILAPHIRVYLFFFLPLRIFHALLLYAAIDIVLMNSNDSVAHSAHLAGALVGVAFAFYIKKLIAKRQSYSVSYGFQTGY